MRFSRSVGALAILAGRGCVYAFRCGPSSSSSSPRCDVDVPSPRPPLAAAAPSSRATRSRLGEGRRQSPPPPRDNDREYSPAAARSSTRRGALRRLRDALLLPPAAAALAAWDGGRDRARASEFSVGAMPEQRRRQLDEMLASDPSPMADGTVAPGGGASADASTSSSSSTAVSAADDMTPAQLKSSAVAAEIFISAAAIFATLYSVSGRSLPKNNDYSAAKAKVVMIQPEPYGLDKGRRYYGGVYLRGGEPIPACDRVRSSCEDGVVDDGCASAISDFLGEVAREGAAGGADAGGDEGPSEEQREAAGAVLAYLDSLSPTPSAARPAPGGGGAVKAAFTSYLDGLSTGQVRPPASPRLVADYLSSLGEVEGRVIALESKVDSLPEEISVRLERRQQERDEELRRELVKIEAFLIRDGVADGGGGGAVDDAVPLVDMNGIVSVNARYGSRPLL